MQVGISQHFLDFYIYMQLSCPHPYFSQSHSKSNPTYIVYTSKQARVILDTYKDVLSVARMNVS